eukprot:905634-Pelagomonas_calceolata.AAC.1
MGIWRVTGSTRLHNQAARSILAFNSTPNNNKLVGIRNIMGMRFASKLNGTLVISPSCLNWEGCVQYNWSRPHPEGWLPVFRVLDFKQVHMSLEERDEEEEEDEEEEKVTRLQGEKKASVKTFDC